MINKADIRVPLTVPQEFREHYLHNYLKATHNTGRLFLFAGDQKIEHVNKDFYGPNIPSQSAHPRHLFDIAGKSRIGVFATHLGLIARYGADYATIPYLVKLNGKTDLLSVQQDDPQSANLATVEQVVAFKKRSNLSILGVGMTVYLGSAYEAAMLAAASQAVQQAHHHGLIAVLWMYPRGKSITNPCTADLVAGAAGVGTCLGADFVKINAPEATTGFHSAQLLQQAVAAAGNTGVICSGGPRKSVDVLLEDIYHQVHVGGALGVALGRNIHQKTVQEAMDFCKAVAAIVIDDADVTVARHYLDQGEQ